MGQSGDYPFFYLLCFEKVQTKKTAMASFPCGGARHCDVVTN